MTMCLNKLNKIDTYFNGIKKRKNLVYSLWILLPNIKE